MHKGGEKSGLLFVVSSPSGAGKTTLCRRLMAAFPQQLAFSISYTTRPPRPSEVEGRDYHFVDEARFACMVAEGCFAEWATVHGHRYGSARVTLEARLTQGKDTLFDIDYQGAAQLKAAYAEDTVMVFVLPPSMAELARRLKTRGTDAEEVVVRRLAKAREELSHYQEYDYLMTNVDLDAAYANLQAIYCAAQWTRARQAHRAQRLLTESAAAGSVQNR